MESLDLRDECERSYNGDFTVDNMYGCIGRSSVLRPSDFFSSSEEKFTFARSD